MKRGLSLKYFLWALGQGELKRRGQGLKAEKWLRHFIAWLAVVAVSLPVPQGLAVQAHRPVYTPPQTRARRKHTQGSLWAFRKRRQQWYLDTTAQDRDLHLNSESWNFLWEGRWQSALILWQGEEKGNALWEMSLVFREWDFVNPDSVRNEM